MLRGYTDPFNRRRLEHIPNQHLLRYPYSAPLDVKCPGRRHLPHLLNPYLRNAVILRSC